MVPGTLREIFMSMKYVQERRTTDSDTELNSAHDGLVQINWTYFQRIIKKFLSNIIRIDVKLP